MAGLDQLTTADYLEMFEQAVSSVEEVCSQLEPADWDRPTDCPGWTVKDTLAHLASYEALAAGLSELATADIAGLAHVKADDTFAVPNEREVQARRATPGPAVLEEFRAATSARLKHLGSLDDAGWAADQSRFPWGTAASRDMLPIRVLDVFFHEQDIRRATGRPGHLDGKVAAFVLDRFTTLAFPRIVGKDAALPDGTVVGLEISPPGRSVTIVVTGGRAVVTEEAARPAVRFAADLEAFFCLMGGRRTPEQLKAEGRLTVEGDQALGAAILDKVVVVP